MFVKGPKGGGFDVIDDRLSWLKVAVASLEFLMRNARMEEEEQRYIAGV